MISLKVWYNREWKRKERMKEQSEWTSKIMKGLFLQRMKDRQEEEEVHPLVIKDWCHCLDRHEEEEESGSSHTTPGEDSSLPVSVIVEHSVALDVVYFCPFYSLVLCHLFNSLVIRVVLVYCVPGTDYSVSLKSREETWRPIIWGDKSDLYFLLRPLLLSSWKVREKPWGSSCLSFSSQEELPSQEEVQERESIVSILLATGHEFREIPFQSIDPEAYNVCMNTCSCSSSCCSLMKREDLVHERENLLSVLSSLQSVPLVLFLFSSCSLKTGGSFVEQSKEV